MWRAVSFIIGIYEEINTEADEVYVMWGTFRKLTLISLQY